MSRTLCRGSALGLMALWALGSCSGEKKETEDESVATAESPSKSVPKEATPPEKTKSPDAVKESPAATPQAPKPGTIRLVVVSAEAPLKSAQREIGKLKKQLGKVGSLHAEEATEAEAAFSQALQGDEPGTPPGDWATTESVVVIGVAPPDVNERGKRVNAGYTTLAILRGDLSEPVYRESNPIGLAEIATIVASLQSATEAGDKQ